MQSGKCAAIDSISPLHQAREPESVEEPPAEPEEAGDDVVRHLKFDTNSNVNVAPHPAQSGDMMEVESQQETQTPASDPRDG